MLPHIFAPDLPALELIVRGTAIYWFLFVLFRFVLRREAGSVGLADILLIVLISDAAQNGLSGDYKSVSGAMILVGTIAFWNMAIDKMSFHYAWFARIAEPPAVTLIRHGRVLRANMRREMVTDSELASALRDNGVEQASAVKRAVLEPDGKISVILHNSTGR